MTRPEISFVSSLDSVESGVASGFSGEAEAAVDAEEAEEAEAAADADAELPASVSLAPAEAELLRGASLITTGISGVASELAELLSACCEADCALLGSVDALSGSPELAEQPIKAKRSVAIARFSTSAFFIGTNFGRRSIRLQPVVR